ncbi:MAG TPA: pyruvate dehydrogenase (acetyl-transferring), homodimeric type [Candidatus Azoamicus sp. OHIO1]
MKKNIHTDINPTETQEWIDSIKYINKHHGKTRAKFLIKTLMSEIQYKKKSYTNTIKSDEDLNFDTEKKFENIIRWNAIAIVLKATKIDLEIGGHIGTYASASTLYEVGFNHFWKSEKNKIPGDLIYIQGHCSPGIYARSFLENRLTEKNLNNFRKETNKYGLSSYPHPWLMKNYWQFPTISMGLGPIQAIYNAKFIKYMINRNLIDKNKNINRKIWCMCGDGEMDEPEAICALTLAGRERLDNLIFVINCNLQRLDGPVRGNGKIIQELENIFSSCNWHVIKLIWNTEWDKLINKDKNNILEKRLSEILDGDYQNYKAHGTEYMKEHIFNTKELKTLIKNYTLNDFEKLNFGGHDYKKVYSAYKLAMQKTGKPIVILVKTIKGYGLINSGESSNLAHNIKTIKNENLIKIKNNLEIPISDTDALNLKFYKPENNNYIIEKRKALGGYLPKRRITASETITIQSIEEFLNTLKIKHSQNTSTIISIVKIISLLCKNEQFGKYIIPIVSDEARTFGMESLFKQIEIYSSVGQLYQPVDIKQFICYKESKTGQLIQEGITEAGAFCTWLSSATSYSNNNKTVIPFYMFYSMFGFQRIGDLIWAAANARARGFLIGAISGKTSLPGEGLQHCDGNSQILASLIPNCKSYDPAFNYELAIIIHTGLKEMIEQQKDIFYYITTYNESHENTQIIINKKIKENIINGMYCYKKSQLKTKNKIELLGSGNMLFEVIEATKILENNFNISVNIWSVTSFTELAREAKTTIANNTSQKKLNKPYVTKCFENIKHPIIAITDFSRIYAEQIREFIPKNYFTLSPDGFGKSDSRKELKFFFKIDKFNIIITALNKILNKNIDKNYITNIKKKFKFNYENNKK